MHLRAAHPKLHFAQAERVWLASLATAPQEVLPLGHVYLIDPQGQLMMEYDTASEAKGMIKDLERLL